MEACVEECLRCSAGWFGTAMQYGLEAAVSTFRRRLVMACAEICRTSAHFMLIGTPHHKHTCRDRAEICEKCILDGGRLDGMKAWCGLVDAAQRAAGRWRRDHTSVAGTAGDRRFQGIGRESLRFGTAPSAARAACANHTGSCPGARRGSAQAARAESDARSSFLLTSWMGRGSAGGAGCRLCPLLGVAHRGSHGLSSVSVLGNALRLRAVYL